MRTEDEIIERIKERTKVDFLGFEIYDLLARLSFEKAKPFLTDDATNEDWANCIIKNDNETVLKEMKAYMPFAWEKANNCRGLSASRSMSHYTTWVWLLNDEEYFGDLLDYEFYGKDNLVKICEKYDWNYTQWDDGIRSNHEY